MIKLLLILLVLVGCGRLPDEGKLKRQSTSIRISYNGLQFQDMDFQRGRTARAITSLQVPIYHFIAVEPEVEQLMLNNDMTAEVLVPVETPLWVEYMNWTQEQPETYYQYGVSDEFIVTHDSPEKVVVNISVDVNPEYPFPEDETIENEPEEETETVDNETVEEEIDPTLLAHYKFEGDLEDSSSYGRHLELCSGSSQFIFVDETVMTVLPSNKAAYFQGTECAENEFRNDNGTKPLDTEADFTISFWILPWLSNTDFDTYHSVMSTGDATSGWKFQIDHHQGSLRFAGQILQLMEEDWMMFTYTKMTGATGSSDNKKVRVYVDGELKSSIYPIWSDFDKLKIGMNRLGGGGWYGLIDDFRIYNRALTADEVEELYESYE